ncbi:MAG: lysoplasmalogenase family protein [Anaerolineae bacterium]
MPVPLLLTLIGWGSSLFGGFIFGKLNAEETRRMPMWTRLISSLCLAVAGWLWWGLTQGTENALYTLPIAVGMSLSFIGDLFMAGLLTGTSNPIGGMIAFGCGHVAYIVGIFQFSDAVGANSLRIRSLSIVVWAVIGVMGWWLAVYLPARGKTHLLHWLALGYGLLLSGTTAAATALSLQAASFVPTALGAAMFLVSDLLIAARMFSDLKFYLIDDLIWLLYGPAQALIVFAAHYALLGG